MLLLYQLNLAGSRTNYTFTAQGGSYVLSGQPAVLARSRELTTIGGTYAYTGQQATILRSREMAAAGGTYAYTGQQATILRSRELAAAGGTYAYTGQNVGLTIDAAVIISSIHANLIYELALLHGLVPGNPLTVSATERTAGGVSQTISGTDIVTITTVSSDVLQGDAGTWINALAAVHGLTTPLVVSAATRTSGTLAQTLTSDGTTTTVVTL